jgi:hypothetical protein
MKRNCTKKTVLEKILLNKHYSDKKFRQIIGQLNGVPFEILIPDNWNGDFIIGCRGYVKKKIINPKNLMLHEQGKYFMNPTKGGKKISGSRFAFTFSTYGESGYCIRKGIESTYYLTKFVVKRFNVSGKIFLYGFSMGV